MKKCSKYFMILFIFVTGCGIFDDPVDLAAATLDEAISSLEIQSANWQTVLEETREELIDQGQSTIANEVANVLSQTVSDVGIEARCYTDFLRDRVKEDLIRIRASITGEELNLVPVFCKPTPRVIDMNLDADRRTYIEISGYNLDAANVTVFLIDNLDHLSDVSFAIGSPSRYLLTLNLGRNGVPLSDASDKLVFELSGGETRTVNIIQPLPTPPPPQDFEYRIDLYTVDKASAPAAEHGRVWVKIIGTQGRTDENLVPGNFRRGEIESTIVSSQDLGSITSAIVRYDDGSDDNAWYLGWIRVINLTTNQEIWFYNCGMWLGNQNPLVKACP